MDEKELLELATRIKRHDWYACMSDSYAVAQAGDFDMQGIRALCRKFPVETVRTIWAQNAPSNFKCPV